MSIKKVEDLASFQKEVASVNHKVLVKFEADWCMPCRAMESIVEEVARQHPEIKFIAVDVEGDGIDSILREYGVRSLPTFVRVENGSPTKRSSGTITKDDLNSLLKDNG